MPKNSEDAVRDVIGTVDRAWREKHFAGLDECFHPDAVITGPDYVEYARGRERCAASYREFASNAAVLSYTETDQVLRTWGTTAVYTFSWNMEYQREKGPRREAGTDELVLELSEGRWQVIFRHIYFAPMGRR